MAHDSNEPLTTEMLEALLTPREKMIAEYAAKRAAKEAAKEAAKMAVEQLHQNFYAEVGKTVTHKILVWIGLAVISYLIGSGKINLKL